MSKIRTLIEIQKLGDEIKDEIDRLDDVVNAVRRVELARDLVEYINMHIIDPVFEYA